jgi:hypothetical protein
MSDAQLALPGMEPARENESPMVRACRQTIDALATAGKLLPHHAVLTQLLMALAEAIDGGRRSGRASAVAMAARELRDTLLMIDPPPEDGKAGADALAALREFQAAVEYAANNGGALPEGWAGR